MSTLDLTRADLLRHLGRHAGWGREPSAWAANAQADAKDIIARAERTFYSPPVLPGDASAHRWSFLRPTGTVPIKADQGDYDLQEDFGGVVGPMTYSDAGGTVWAMPVEQASDERIRQIRLSSGILSSYPTLYAIVPMTTDGSSAQRFTLMLDRSQEGVLTFRYRSNPYQISDQNPYPLGGQAHAETLLASVIAAYDAVLQDDPMGANYTLFIDRLRASISHDREESAARNLGYAGNGTILESVPSRSRRVTFEGVEYGVS